MPTTPTALTVPLQVDAMIVPASDSSTWAPPTTAAPFAAGTRPAAGVHVHWKIPDGLTRGSSSKDGYSFPALPDLWLVIRLGPPEGTSGQRLYKRIWVVDSIAAARDERYQPTVLNNDWVKPTRAAEHPRLSAVGFLNASGRAVDASGATQGGIRPAFTSYRPDSGGCFTLTDNVREDLPSWDTGLLTYIVVGWYADPADDPMNGSLEDRRKFLKNAQWKLPFDIDARDDLPNRTLCHGMLVGVAPQSPYNKGGGSPDTRDELARVRAALGSSDLEAYARIEHAEAPELGLLLGVTMTRSEQLLSEAGGLAQAAAMLHSRSFLAQKGEQPPKTIRVTKDPVAALRRAGAPTCIAQLSARGVPAALVRWLQSASALIERMPTARRERTEDALLRVFGQVALLLGASPAALERSDLTRTDLFSRAPRNPAALAALATLAATLPTVTNPSLLEEALVRVETQLRGKAGRRLETLREEVAHAGEPYWKRCPTALSIVGAGNTLRHGHDGRFEADGTLACRTTRHMTIGSLFAVGERPATPGVTVPELIAQSVFDPSSLPATLPEGVAALVAESLLFDPANAMAFARADKAENNRPWAPGDARDVIEAEAEYIWLRRDPREDPADVQSSGAYLGTLPSPLAVNPWREPWAPMFLEYSLEYAAHPVAGWSLGDVDYEPPVGSAPALDWKTFKGRTFVSHSARKVLGSAFEQLHEQAGDDDHEDLTIAAASAHFLDVLSASLTPTSSPDPSGPDNFKEHVSKEGLSNAGAIRVNQVRVIDAFGQVMDLPLAQMPSPLSLPPRLRSPARVRFRYLSAKSPDRERIDGDHVVCALLRMDHLDRSLEFYTTDGDAVGQLVDLNHGTVWDPAPGRDARVGARPTAADFADGGDAAAKMIAAILDPKLKSDDRSKLTPLETLITALDTTLRTVQRAPPSTEGLALLTSRPIALVRARLVLEAPEDSLVPESQRGLPESILARLGGLQDTDDGLLGYFVNDDYGTFYALDRGALKGKTNPYVSVAESGAGVVDIPSTGGLVVTMLLAVGGTAHVTTGLLPRIDRRPAWDSLAAALAKLTPTFRVGPVLVDPTQPGFSLPQVPDQTWKWKRRVVVEGKGSAWSEEDPAPPEDRLAKMVVQSGWIAPAPPDLT